MPAQHHSEYLTAICPLTESTIKKLYTPMPGQIWNGQDRDVIIEILKNSRCPPKLPPKWD